MIKGLRHRGLRRLFEDDDHRGVPPAYAARLGLILAALDAVERVEDMDIATFRLHQLRGTMRGLWSVTVRANWRVVFRFGDGGANDVDLIDYH